MIVLIDIGNTAISIGLGKKNKVFKAGKIKNHKNKNVSFYNKEFKNYFTQNRIDKKDIELVLYCSVVPSLDSKIERSLKKLLNVKVIQAGRDIKFTVKNRYRQPEQVGCDRLANAVAACNYYKKSNVIIVDFGTAVTFDVVNKKGEYLGGLITPGIETSINSLSYSAELLPKVDLRKPISLIGKNTKSSINNGMVFAFVSACNGIIDRLKKEFSKDIKVIATGGHASLIKKYSESINKVIPNLTLEGLYISYIQETKN